MMRMQTAIFCALTASLAFAVSCADSEGDDGMGDDDGQSQNVCGDGVCAAAEVGLCTNDCGNGGNNNGGAVCGNGMCETTLGENGGTCLMDCNSGPGSGGGSGGGGGSTTCPTDPIECLFCTFDPSLCMGGLTQATCQACIGGGGGGGGGFGDAFCEGMAADGTCNAGAGEDATTCPSDCP